MALVLEIAKGRGFYVGDKKVTVEKIYSPSRLQLMVHGPMSTLIEVNNKIKTEIMPNVYVQAGRDRDTGSGELCKVAITAPRSIRILRDSLYPERNSENHKSPV